MKIVQNTNISHIQIYIIHIPKVKANVKAKAKKERKGTLKNIKQQESIKTEITIIKCT